MKKREDEEGWCENHQEILMKLTETKLRKIIREILTAEDITSITVLDRDGNPIGEDRDYRAEYKKFQSSPKRKKYRAELNKYNRDHGTYGNGDGKDASHKGGKISGFERESVNRGRAEKSRLKQETDSKCKNKKNKLDEAISKEEWQGYVKYGRELKKYMGKLMGIPIKARVIKSAVPNPFIEIRVAKFGEDVIPNDVRKLAAKTIHATGVRNWKDINYGNIQSNSITLHYSTWKEMLPGKIKESVSTIKEARPTDVGAVMKSITKSPFIEKRINMWSIGNGYVGLFRTKDGNAYEIIARPARVGQFKDLFKKHLEKKK